MFFYYLFKFDIKWTAFAWQCTNQLSWCLKFSSAEYSICLIFGHPHNISLKIRCNPYFFYRREDWGLYRLSKLLKITQLGRRNPDSEFRSIYVPLRRDCQELSQLEERVKLLSLCCCCSVARLCLTFCDSIHCSMPGFLVLHWFPKFAQTETINEAIQPYPLLPSSLALDLSQHQGLFQWVSSLH